MKKKNVLLLHGWAAVASADTAPVGTADLAVVAVTVATTAAFVAKTMVTNKITADIDVILVQKKIPFVSVCVKNYLMSLVLLSNLLLQLLMLQQLLPPLLFLIMKMTLELFLLLLLLVALAFFLLMLLPLLFLPKFQLLGGLLMLSLILLFLPLLLPLFLLFLLLMLPLLLLQVALVLLALLLLLVTLSRCHCCFNYSPIITRMRLHINDHPKDTAPSTPRTPLLLHSFHQHSFPIHFSLHLHVCL